MPLDSVVDRRRARSAHEGDAPREHQSLVVSEAASSLAPTPALTDQRTQDPARPAQRLRRAGGRVVAADDSGRRRLERDLHDGVQQSLIVLLIKLRAASQLAGEGGVTPETIDEIAEGLETAIDELRDVARGIYPGTLTASGIVAALRDVRVRSAVPISLQSIGMRRYQPELESAVYYCCLEAIQNATKHGGPSVRISITLQQDTDRLRFAVSDDGYGFDPRRSGHGTGLQNMYSRIAALTARSQSSRPSAAARWSRARSQWPTSSAPRREV